MAHTIRAFQEDQAVLLVDQIGRKIGDNSVSVERVHSLMVKHGIVSDITYWRNVEGVLNDLGFDYDEIFEVAP